jgi:hypothetical protein
MPIFAEVEDSGAFRRFLTFADAFLTLHPDLKLSRDGRDVVQISLVEQLNNCSLNWITRLFISSWKSKSWKKTDRWPGIFYRQYESPRTSGAAENSPFASDRRHCSNVGSPSVKEIIVQTPFWKAIEKR